MSKNLTRKGLAFGALVALGSTVIAGAPAYAADEVVLGATTGTALAVPVTESISLSASLVSSVPASNIAQLKFKLATDGSFVAKAVATTGGTPTSALYTTTAGSASFVGATNYVAANVATSKVLTPGTTPTTTNANTLVLSVDAVADATTPTTGVAPSKTTATKSVDVTAWIDSDLDGVVDAGEFQKTQTVKFLKYSEITSNVVITAPTEGDTTVAAKLNFTNINNEQLAKAEVGALFTKGDGTALDADESNVIDANVDWSATSGSFSFVTSTIGQLVKDTAVKVTPLFKNGGISDADGSADVAETVGTAVTATVATRKIATFTADAVKSATANVASAGTANVALNGAFELVATAKDSSTPEKAVAGVPVTAKIEVAGATLSSTVTVTVAGTTYTSAASLPGATNVARLAVGNTDANGQVKLAIKATGFADTNDVVVTFYAENFNAAVTANNQTLDYKAYLENGIDGLTTVDGTAASVKVIVRDQFGGVAADNKFQVAADFVSSTQATTAATSATTTWSPVVGSAATLTITDNGTGAGVNKYDLDLNAIGSNGALSADENDFVNDLEINVLSAAAVPGEVSLVDNGSNVITQDATTKVYKDALVTGNGGSGELLLADMFANDGRTSVAAAPVVTSAVGASIEGYVKTAATATAVATGISGQTVTLSAPGLLFATTVQGSKTVYAVDSITVYADKTGKFTATAWSNKAGVQTVTVASGSAKATLNLDKFDAAAASTGTSVAITAPATIVPGRTLEVSVLVTDKYGNAVDTDGTNTSADAGADLSVAYAGPGIAINTIAQQTDATGAVKFAVLLGAADAGSATVTVKYDANGDADYADTGDIVKTATIAIAAPVVVVPEVKTTIVGVTKAIRVRVENAKGEEVEVVVNGRTVAVAIAGTNSKLWVLKSTKGKKSVKVYVDGDLVAVKTVTVK
jgi:hypothetical protein